MLADSLLGASNGFSISLRTRRGIPEGSGASPSKLRTAKALLCRTPAQHPNTRATPWALRWPSCSGSTIALPASPAEKNHTPNSRALRLFQHAGAPRAGAGCCVQSHPWPMRGPPHVSYSWSRLWGEPQALGSAPGSESWARRHTVVSSDSPAPPPPKFCFSDAQTPLNTARPSDFSVQLGLFAKHRCTCCS